MTDAHPSDSQGTRETRTSRTDAATSIYAMNPGAGVTAYAFLCASLECDLAATLAAKEAAERNGITNAKAQMGCFKQ